MSIITLEEAKAQCRITDTLEDTLVQLYIDAAEDYICNFLNCPNPPQNASVKAGALLLVHDMWENRSAQVESELKQNQAVYNLLYPYRKSIGI